jgi:hypothetical protein
MADPAQRIIDLLIDYLIDDQRCPRMSWLAWSVKLRPLRQQINDIVDDIRHETRNDLLKETID